MATKLKTLETYSYSEYLNLLSFYGGLKLLDNYYRATDKTGNPKYVIIYKEERK